MAHTTRTIPYLISIDAETVPATSHAGSPQVDSPRRSDVLDVRMGSGAKYSTSNGNVGPVYSRNSANSSSESESANTARHCNKTKLARFYSHFRHFHPVKLCKYIPNLQLMCSDNKMRFPIVKGRSPAREKS